MIKSGSLFVAPGKAESAIFEHRAVDEVAVIGLPQEKWKEAVTAHRVLKEGRVATAEEIRKHCREYLSGFQVPKAVYFSDKLPKHPDHGKVLVKDLQRVFGGKKQEE